MMPDSVDKLQIEITSSTEKAQRSIKKLNDSLTDLARNMKGIEGSKGLEDIAKAAKAAGENGKKATKDLDSVAKSSEKVAKSVAAPFEAVASELDKVKKRISEATNITESARQRLLAKANAPLSGSKYHDNSEATMAKRAQVRASFLEEELNEAIEIAKKTEEQAAAEEAVNEKIRERAKAYSDAYNAMKEAMPDTAYNVGSGMWRGGGEIYRVSDFMGSGEDTASKEADRTESALNRIKTASEAVRGALSTVAELARNVTFGVSRAAVSIGGHFANGVRNAAGGVLRFAQAIDRAALGVFQKTLKRATAATRQFAGAIAQLGGKLTALPFAGLTKRIGIFRGASKSAFSDTTKSISVPSAVLKKETSASGKSPLMFPSTICSHKEPNAGCP